MLTVFSKRAAGSHGFPRVFPGFVGFLVVADFRSISFFVFRVFVFLRWFLVLTRGLLCAIGDWVMFCLS